MVRCCKGEDNHLSISVFSKYSQIVMLRYINTDIVFQEFPDEVTRAINISGCPCRVRAAIVSSCGQIGEMN